MSLPSSNTTCDVYRNGNAPPAAPDVAAVKGFLTADFGGPHTAAMTTTTSVRWTHVLLVPPGTDLRDGYGPGSVIGQETIDTTKNDWVYVPDKNGTKFAVIFVERLGRGTSQDCLRAYLQRQVPAWPTSQL
jgi:hypothetical protein